MIADAIQFVLSNIPLLTFIAAIICAATLDRDKPWAERYLAWILLLPVGVSGVWAGLFHIFFPAVASGQIGWQASPFETEIGIADVASGIVAIVAFWRSYAYKAAIALYTILAFAGFAIGHFYQAFAHNDFSPDNFGLMLVITIVIAVALSFLLWAARPHAAGTARRTA